IALSGVALLVATLWLSARLSLEVSPNDARAARLAAWFVVASYALAFWTLRGMEVGLVAVLILASILLMLVAPSSTRVWRPMVGLAAVTPLAALTRPDAALPILAAALVTEVVSPAWRRGARVGVVATSAIATTAVLTWVRLRLYGAAVPNTYTLKL